MDTNNLGAFGEDKAAKYLALRGYKIIERNFRCRQGEIDIIARRGSYLVFAEVKLRKSSDYGQAKEFVTAAKQSRLITAANIYLSCHETELQPRFDVIEVYAPRGTESKKIKINHIKNAFDGE